MKKQIIQYINLKKIKADPDQPRKLFDASKLNKLIESIKREGILDPLKVEEMENGTYKLIDGERRFRSATFLKLQEVPIIVMESKDESDKLIKQFHLQQTHESWTATETAVAIVALAKELNLAVNKVARLIGMSEKQASSYASFAGLINKEKFVKSEIPLDFASKVKFLTQRAKRVHQEVTEEEFTGEMAEKFESRIIDMCKNGDIQNTTDFAKIKDTFTQDHKQIIAVIKGTAGTADGMFLKSKAQAAHFLRNSLQSASYAAMHAKHWMAKPKCHPTKEQISTLKRNVQTLNEMVDLYEHKLNLEID